MYAGLYLQKLPPGATLNLPPFQNTKRKKWLLIVHNCFFIFCTLQKTKIGFMLKSQGI